MNKASPEIAKAGIATPSGKNATNENFPVGSALIRADLRPHVHAFYRFARMGDDIADNNALSPQDKVARLDMMEAVLLDSMREDIREAADLRRSLAQTHVAPINSTELLKAFRMDATKQRYADWEELMTYCRYSAAPVGRQLLDLHGEPVAARGPSDALCAALQVINHLQDCGVDYLEMDRVYFPQDHLARHGAATKDLSERGSSPAVAKALNEALDKTDALMVEARQLPGRLKDFRLRAESATIVRLADKMIGQLRRNDPLAGRVKPTKMFFLTAMLEGIAWACFARGK
ncbi:squalene synthase HpnC [Dongia rigui]|uniref:Squalene synthase HpnC n=1 Tax=Dongia rigui TaxID=940149 RepID=A0ABU5E4A6_9PROT|nr:squalene synthase HpnC [Dongia rigui]MDY0874024.1 squalene synthase HpnC [Dongia rigui]